MCLFSESSCALCFRKYRETLSLKTCTSLKTRTYVHKIRSAAQNVFWFPMLCVCVERGSTCYVREYFHCVLLLRPEERENFLLHQIKTCAQTMAPQHKNSDLACLRCGKLLLHCF